MHLEDWILEGTDEGLVPGRLRVASGGVQLELGYDSKKARVLQGDAGYSRKGSAPGNASHYYSYTRLETRGELVVDGESRELSGTLWFDHEWSTSVLEEHQVGWDWFSLQLDDERELMVYQLRDSEGRPDENGRGVLVDADGRARSLGAHEFTIEPSSTWTSPATNAVYPSAWNIVVPSAELALEVEARIADQELQAAVIYWEGSVRAFGTSKGQPVEGLGYAELTGYEKNRRP